jgi:TP901 family phage tail tape measure protein
MNRFLQNLAGTTKEKRKELNDSGMNFWETDKDGHEHLKDLGQVIEIVRQKFKGMKSDKDKIVLGEKLFGEEGGRVAEFFAGMERSFGEFEESLKGATGFEQKLQIQMEGLGSAYDRLKNTTMSLADEGFAPLRSGLTDIVNYINDNLTGKKSVKKDVVDGASHSATSAWGAVEEGAQGLWHGLLGDDRPLFPSVDNANTTSTSDKEIVIVNNLHIDGKQVASSVNRTNEKDARRK